MRNLFLIVFFVLPLTIFNSCNDEEDELTYENIDYNNPMQYKMFYQNDEYKNLVTEQQIKNFFNDILKEENKQVNTSNFKIVEMQLENSTVKHLLVGTSIDNRIKIGLPIEIVDGNIKVIFGETVTCEGCPDGCNPWGSEGNWRCTPCGFGSELGCKKTVVKSPDRLEPHISL